MHWNFPPACDMHEESPLTPAAEDTFFVNEVPLGGPCSFSADPNATPCQNAVFTATKALMLVYQPTNEDPLDDYASIYALRFAMPAPVYEDEMVQVPVPVDAFLKVKVHIRLFRPPMPAPWMDAQFEIRRFTPGERWQNDADSDFAPCYSPASSYRCFKCPDKGMDLAELCKTKWNKDTGVPPYDPGDKLLLDTVKVAVAPGVDGYELPITKTFTKEDLNWLMLDGLAVVPLTPLKNIIEARALETENEVWYPGLTVTYCKPTMEPDKP